MNVLVKPAKIVSIIVLLLSNPGASFRPCVGNPSPTNSSVRYTSSDTPIAPTTSPKITTQRTTWIPVDHDLIWEPKLQLGGEDFVNLKLLNERPNSCRCMQY
jgi:hypothetical protein